MMTNTWGNPYREPCCDQPRCGHLIPSRDRRDGGWCGHPKNRVQPQPGWPDGFTPSVASTGTCEYHTSRAALEAAGEGE